MEHGAEKQRTAFEYTRFLAAFNFVTTIEQTPAKNISLNLLHFGTSFPCSDTPALWYEALSDGKAHLKRQVDVREGRSISVVKMYC